jgi:3-hydroxyacyl-CoA dehydrogenase
MNREIKKIGVIGAGTIGSGWATFFAMKGYHVELQDINEAILTRATQCIRLNVDFLAERGLIKNEAIEPTLDRIIKTTKLKEAVSDVDYVQESTFESYDVKKRIFKEMDSVCPKHAIIASSSSGLLMSEIQRVTNKPERCIIAHPFNPPHLMPLVEIVPGKQTSEKTASTVYDFFVRLGKVPVLLKKEIPGYIANRLSAALWREAIDLVNEGIATVEDVDKALSAGPGLRWALMGPHMTYHLGGGKGGIEYFIDHLGPAFESWWQSMNTWTAIPYFAVKKIERGIKDEMGTRTLEEVAKWRDEKLIDLLKIIWRF